MDSLSMFVDKSKKQHKDSRRKFTRSQEKEIWAKQKGKCWRCSKVLDPRFTEYDHIKPHSKGGKTEVKNGRAVCSNCHKIITHKNLIKNLNEKDKKNLQKKKDSSFNLANELKLPKNDFLDSGFNL
jgi:5-methylcytosine-specific restriction endonuclease McrA